MRVRRAWIATATAGAVLIASGSTATANQGSDQNQGGELRPRMHEVTIKVIGPDGRPARWTIFYQETDGRRTAEVMDFRGLPADGTSWNAAPFSPSWRGLGSAERQNGELMFNLMPHGDQAGHSGYSPLDCQSMRLYRGGQLVAATTSGLELSAGDQPAGSARYRLEASYTRPSWSDLSSQTPVVWTFTSKAAPALTELPLETDRFRPAVDERNLVKADADHRAADRVRRESGCAAGDRCRRPVLG